MSERYKKEIEEILKQAGELGSGNSGSRPRPGLRRLIWVHVAQSLGGKTWSLSAGRVMLIAVVLLLSALVVGAIIPGLVGILAWAGLILFIVGYAMFFIRPSRVEKRWRGQPIEYEGASWWDRLRRKMK